MLFSHQTHPVILLVDDDPAVCDVTALALQEAGYRVVTAATQAEALLALATVRFHLILADSADVPTTTVPWASLERLHEAAGATPVVIFTAHAPSRFAGYAERGFAGVIPKPFDLDDLLAQVQTYLQAA